MQRWDLVLDNVPDQLKIDAEIAMNQTVARSGHPAPVRVGVAAFEVIGEVLDRFADDFQTADKGPLQRFIGKEGIQAEGARGFQQVFGFNQNMFKVASGWFQTGPLGESVGAGWD